MINNYLEPSAHHSVHVDILGRGMNSTEYVLCQILSTVLRQNSRDRGTDEGVRRRNHLREELADL